MSKTLGRSLSGYQNVKKQHIQAQTITLYGKQNISDNNHLIKIKQKQDLIDYYLEEENRRKNRYQFQINLKKQRNNKVISNMIQLIEIQSQKNLQLQLKIKDKINSTFKNDNPSYADFSLNLSAVSTGVHKM